MPKFFKKSPDRAAVQRGLALLGNMAKEAYSPKVYIGKKGGYVPANKYAWKRKYQTRAWLRSKAGKYVNKGF